MRKVTCQGESTGLLGAAIDPYRIAIEAINDQYPEDSLNPRTLAALDGALFGYIDNVVEPSDLTNNEKSWLRALCSGLFLTKYQHYAENSKR